MTLTATQTTVLHRLINGWTLKSHRDLDGQKIYTLHSLDGAKEPIDRETVQQLAAQGLIHSNQKFPAATYLLTDKGRQLAEPLAASEARPLGASNFR